MLIPSYFSDFITHATSLSRGMNANSQPDLAGRIFVDKSIKRDEC